MKYDFVIIGAGIVGSAVALSLIREGHSVAVIEHSRLGQQDLVKDKTQVFMLNSSSLSILRDIGTWSQINHDQYNQVFDIKILGDGLSEINFNSSNADFSALGYTVEKHNLLEVLHRQLQQSNMAVFDNQKIENLVWGKNHISVQLKQNKNITSDVIVAADGANSYVRNLANIKAKTNYYNQIAIVCRLVGRASKAVAYQWFQKKGNVVALLPINENEFGLVWSISEDLGLDMISKGKGLLIRELKEITSCDVGELEIVDQPKYFPINAIHPESVIKTRLALVGDAAGTIHPMAGQGLNLGLLDARILSDVFSKKANSSIFSTLRRYERRRAEKVAIMRGITNGLYKIFSSDVMASSYLRAYGLKIFERAPALKKLAFKVASN